MKILVTGLSGYIAKSFAEHTSGADLICLRDGTWQNVSFTGYDVVLHTAGLAHKRETRRNRYDYFLINRDLAEQVAKKAKASGVRQFIFLSSISVYGLTTGIITSDTPTVPTTHYGRSKLAAESLLTPLADENFRVAILRPPMVYGPGSPGNYSKLSRLVKVSPIFPDYPNSRSMVSIDNLCSFITDIIENKRSGLFFPKDPEPVSTTSMAVEIAKSQGKNLHLTKSFNGLITMLMPIGMVSKLFGTLIIEC